MEKLDLERVAAIIEEVSMQKTVRFVLRQHEDDESDVKLYCVSSSGLSAAVKALEEEGFTKGPNVSEEVMLKEGREMVLRFKGNVVEVNNAELKKKFLFYKKMRWSFKVKEVDKFAQHSFDQFKGKVLVVRCPLENDISRFANTSKRDKKNVNEDDLHKLVELDIQIPKVSAKRLTNNGSIGFGDVMF